MAYKDESRERYAKSSTADKYQLHAECSRMKRFPQTEFQCLILAANLFYPSENMRLYLPCGIRDRNMTLARLSLAFETNFRAFVKLYQ